MKKKSNRKKTAAKKTKKSSSGSKKQKNMSSKSRFSKKELEGYRDRLLDLKDDLIKQIQEISEESLRKSQNEASGDITTYSMHLADRASDSYERDFNLNLVSSEKRIVIEIDKALKRLELDEYGFCLSCKKPITKQRLNAIPYARYGTKCQEEIEKEQSR